MSLKLVYNPYIAVIGDIKNSKEIAERRNIQLKLKEVLDKINEKYESAIASKFMITLGDEFQGLLCHGKDAIDIIEEIQQEMYPVQIRFGVGIGAISTDINPEMAIGADGPGYYKARAAIEWLKDSEQRSKVQASDIRIEIENDRNSNSRLLNTILALMTTISNNWSERQREIIWDFERYKGSQAECAERLGVTQSSVQRSLTNGNYYAYKDAKDTIKEALTEVGGVRV